MSCAHVRVALSAALDDETPGLDAAFVNRHLARCPDCRQFASIARSLQRSTRKRSGERAPDLSTEILAALDRDDRSP